MNKKTLSRALCISAICCILASNISYADTDNSKTQKDSCTCTAETLEKLNETYYNTVNTDERLTLLSKIECMTNKIEGEYSHAAFYNAINYANLYSEKRNLKLRKEYLDKAKAIADKIDDNKELLAKYYDELGGFYGDTENFYEAIEALKTADKLAQGESIKIRLATSYVAIKDFKNAQIEFNKLLKMISDDKNAGADAVIRTLAQKMYFYKDQADFKDVVNTYKFASSIYGKTANKDANIEIELYMPIIALYNDLEDVAKLKLAIDKTYKLALEANNEDAEYYTYGEYITYARRLEDKRLTKSYLTKKERKAKKLFGDENIVEMEIFPTYADYYELIGNKEKAKTYRQKVVDIAKADKEVAPIVYAARLTDLAGIQADTGNSEDAIKNLDVAKELYAKAYPEVSFRFYELEKKYGGIYNRIGATDKALEHYKNAETILNKIATKPFGDFRDLYEDISRLYIQKGNLDEAVKYADKTISVSTKLYGQKHIKTAKALLLKAEIYNIFAQNDLRDSVIKILDNIVDEGIECYIGYFTYDYNNFLFNVYIEKGEYDKALTCAEIMLDEARGKWHKENANQKLSQVYKLQDKKLKSFKYKVKSFM